jgi:stringent starvation protein B
MTTPTAIDNSGTSTRPYLIRALHDWCTDNGFTPYIAVFVDAGVRVPMEYVKDNEIVLNVGFEATSGLKLGNDWIEFKARFAGGPREISVPVDHVIAIYARENGQGMAFPMPTEPSQAREAMDQDDGTDASGATVRQPGLSAAPTHLRSLRLATGDAASSPVHGVEHSAGEDENDPEPPTPNPGAGRPSLKRIK